MSVSIENDIQRKILTVIQDLLQIIRTISYERLQYFTEEDTKVKLVLPFLKIFGWDPLNPQDVEMEVSFFDSEIGKTSTVDCVLWARGKPHIFVETKRLNDNLPDPRHDQKANLMLRYAKRDKVKYGIFTNFLSMGIYDPKSLTRVGNYPDPSYYSTNLNELSKILTKPEEVKEMVFTRDFPKCFGTFSWDRSECLNCNYIRPIQVMCRAVTKLDPHSKASCCSGD